MKNGATPHGRCLASRGAGVGNRGMCLGIKEAAYTVERTDGDFQVRRYSPQVVAETVVDGTLEEAGNKAFRPLFNYISGANRSKGKIAMTAPVAQQREGEKIAMTAPVGQEALSNQWAVTFMMPTNYTMETLPEPTDEKVVCAPFRPGAWPRCSTRAHGVSSGTSGTSPGCGSG